MKTCLFLIFTFYLGVVYTQDGVAALLGGSLAVEAGRQTLYFSSSLNPQRAFNILLGISNNLPYATEFLSQSTDNIWALGGSISTTCTGSTYGLLSVYLQSGSNVILVKSWSTNQGPTVNVVGSQPALTNNYYFITLENVGTGGCTTTVSNIQFGLLNGPFPGPSDSYAHIGDCSGSFTGAKHEYTNITGYTGFGSEGSPIIYPTQGSIFVPGPAIIILGYNGTFGTNCEEYGGFGEIEIYENSVLLDYIEFTSNNNLFSTIQAGIVPAGGAYYYAVTAVSTVGFTCTNTWSNIYMGVNVIINT